MESINSLLEGWAVWCERVWVHAETEAATQCKLKKLLECAGEEIDQITAFGTEDGIAAGTAESTL